MKKCISFFLILIVIMQAASVSAASYVMHTVKDNESYYTISGQYGVSVENLMQLNNANNSTIRSGQLIQIKALPWNQSISVRVNSQLINMDTKPYLENSTTYVPIRFIAESLGAHVTWDNENKIAIISLNDTVIELPIGSSTAVVNNKTINTEFRISILNSRTFAPLRFIAETLGFNVSWHQLSYTASIGNNVSIASSINYSEEDLYWLSRIVEAESKGEPYAGKLAVANVVINRKNSKEFPNTIKEVIFDTSFGYQFTPVKNGAIYNNPSNESIEASKHALSGNNNVSSSIYFLNPAKTNNTWIASNNTLFGIIGNHHFYK